MTVRIERLQPDAWERSRLERQDAATFVACRTGEDVGLVVGARHPRHHTDAGLYGMWVAPAERGAGIAVALIDAVVTWARADGYLRVRLEVADANHAAIALYERMGFVSTGPSGTLPPPRQHITEHERVLELARP